MKYNILVLTDIHWGAIDPDTQYDDLEQVFIFLKEFSNIDLIVIGGDYFDSKLSLNSKASILSVQWMERLITESESCGVKKIRVIKGTQEHDNSQLEVFREKESERFKIFNTNTVEETLPDMKCIYCPDENINAKDYKEIYIDNILSGASIGFFHGSFDIVLPDIVVQMSEDSSLKSMIFEYNFWSKFISGPMIAGHWHSGVEIDDLIYVGSYERWAFGESEPKGFGVVQFDTDSNEYIYHKIENAFADIYETVEINTSLYKNLSDYKALMTKVDNLCSNYGDNIYVRIVINVDDDKVDNDTFITSLRHYFINNKKIKIVLKDKLKKKKAKEEKQHHIETKTKYGFVTDKSLSEAQKIQEYISVTKQKDIPIDVIESFIQKYLNK